MVTSNVLTQDFYYDISKTGVLSFKYLTDSEL